MMVNTMGVLNLLEELRCNANLKSCRFYQASTSEMFGGSPPPQNEKTTFYPKSPYGVSKLAAYHLVVNYRESYNLFVSNGILFNHESSRRGKEFVTRKITKAVAAISKGGPVLKLGNLDAVRDWGHSKDFVEAQYLLLHQEKAMDLVIGTGIGTTVRSFVEKAFKVIGVDIKWEGKALNEVGKDAKNNKIVVMVDKEFFRPAEVETLICDNTKMKAVLKWQPKITLDEMVKEMVEADIAGNDC
jgi:GDPmannose 4,6-dehydratase